MFVPTIGRSQEAQPCHNRYTRHEVTAAAQGVRLVFRQVLRAGSAFLLLLGHLLLEPGWWWRLLRELGSFFDEGRPVFGNGQLLIE